MKEIILQGNYQFKYVATLGPKRAGNWRVPVSIEIEIVASNFQHVPYLKGIYLIFDCRRCSNKVCFNDKLSGKNYVLLEGLTLYSSIEPWLTCQVGNCNCERGFGYLTLVPCGYLKENISVNETFYFDYNDYNYHYIIKVLKSIPEILKEQLANGIDKPELNLVTIRTE